jgi:hypothetical protein
MPPGNREITLKLKDLSMNAKMGNLYKESRSQEKSNKQLQMQEMNDDEDDDDLLQSCDFSGLLSNSTNNKCKRTPSLDCISGNSSSEFGGKKLKKQPTKADYDDEDELLLQGNFIKQVENAALSTKNNVLNTNKNIQNTNMAKEPSPPVIKNRANRIQEINFKEKRSHKSNLTSELNLIIFFIVAIYILGYEDMMDFEEVNFELRPEETKKSVCISALPNQKREMKPDPILKQEIKSKPESHFKQERAQIPDQPKKPKIETLIPFTNKVYYLTL